MASLLVFSSGGEVMAGLSAFAERHQVGASHFTAIEVLSDATLGWFSWEQKTYQKIPVREQMGDSFQLNLNQRRPIAAIAVGS